MANFFDQFDPAPAPAAPAPAANFFDQFDPAPEAPKVPSWAEHAGPQPTTDAMGNVTGGLDTGMNVPETPATIAAQQDQLVTGRKPAVMFPKGTAESALPEDFARVETDRGVFHYDPTKYKAAEIRAASKAGKENELLGLGPFSKPEVDARVANGEAPIAVTERQPDGTEVKSAIGTEQTAPAQVKALDKTKTPGNSVVVETPADVIKGRLEPGNIDLATRPVVPNGKDQSTVRSISVGFDDKEYLIPTVSDDGRLLSNDEAIAEFKRTGKHLGVFDNPADATKYAKQLHLDQEKQYAGRPLPADVPLPPTRPAGLGVNEADVPLPPVKPMEIKSPVQDMAEGVDDVAMRRRMTNPVDSTQFGMLSQGEANQAVTDRIAGARADLDEANQRLLATVERKKVLDGLPAARRGTPGAQQRLIIENEYKDASVAYDAARSALATAESTAAPTQSKTRDALESAAQAALVQIPKTVAGFFRPVDAVVGTKVGQAVQAETDRIEKMFPGDPTRQQEFTHQLAQGAGSAGAFVLTGFAGRAAGLSAGMSSGLAGGFGQSEDYYRQAEKKGQEGWNKWKAYITGFPIGASEGFLGLGKVADVLDKQTGGGLKRWLGLVLKEGGEEAVQEATQQLADNLAQYGLFGIDPGDITKDVAQNALTGAILGGVMAGVLGAPGSIRSRGTGVSSKAQIDKFISDAAAVNTPSAPADIDKFVKEAETIRQNVEAGRAPGDAGSPRLSAPGAAPTAAAGNPESVPPSAPAADATANYFDQFDPPTAPQASQEPAGAAPAPTSETASPEAEAAPALPDTPETRILRKAGYADEDIGAMGAAQIAEEVKAAAEEGITDPGPSPAAGSRAAPVKVATEADLEPARAQVAEPTEAQKEAGNYSKGHAKVDGFDVTIENAKGSVRSGKDADGKPWQTTLPADYGYIKGSKGADGDHVDTYIGPHGATGKAFVVEQHDPKTGKFDELKVVMGVNTSEEARSIYDAAFSDGSGPQRGTSMHEMSTTDLRTWLDKGGGKGKVPKRWRTGDPATTSKMEAVAPKPESSTGLSEMGGKMAGAMGENLRQMLWDRVQAGKTTENGGQSAILQGAKMLRDKGGLQTREQFDAYAKEQAAIPSGPGFQQAMRDLLARHLPAQATVPAIKPNTEHALDVLEDVANAAEENQNPKTPDDFEKAIKDRILAVPGMTVDDINKEALEEAAFKAHSGEVPIEEAYARAAMEIAERDLRVMEKERAAAEHRQTKAVEKPTAAKVKPAAGKVAESDQRPAVRSAEGAGPDEEGEVLAVGKGADGGVRAAENSAPDGPGETEAAAGRSNTEHVEEAKPAGLVDALKERLQGDGFKNILDARRLAKENGFKPAEGTPENKQIEEAIENALVEAGREVVQGEGTPQEKYDSLVDLYNKQPRLGTRTSASVAEQAYSTPLPLAYVASQLAGITDETSVLEPTAGNGALLMAANPKKATANEINPVRAAILAKQGFKVTRHDGSVNDFGNGYQVVIANPPFGVVRDGGETRQWKIDGLTTSQVDHAIALNALSAMDADGRAVLIIGGIKAESDAERAKGYTGKSKREFFYRLGQKYKIVDHFTVSGDLYERQGAAWPVDVIVIHGRGKSDRKPPSAQLPVLIKSWDELKGKLDDVAISEQGERQAVVGADKTADGAGDGGGQRAGSAAVGREPARAGRPAERVAKPVNVAPVVVANDDRGQPADSGQRGVADVSAERQEPKPVRERRGADLGADTNGGRPRVAEDVNAAGQLSYKAASKEGKSLGTLVPANLQQSTQESLARVQRKHGNIDDYVADELGYKVEELGKYFSAEQVDAIALGLNNIEAGDGFIIGDQCVAGETLIYDPVAKTKIAIEKLFEAGRPITVLSLTRKGFKPFQAGAPFLKGTAPLYRVSFADGGSIVVTAGHRFLSSEGWISIRLGLAVGSRLLSDFSSQDVLSSDNVVSSLPSYARADDRRSIDITQGSQHRYSSDPRLYDEQLLLGEDTDLASAPSQGDVLEHIHCCSREDGSELSKEYSHHHLSSDLRSRSNSSPSESRDPLQISSRERASCAPALPMTRQGQRLIRHGKALLRREAGGVCLDQREATDHKLSFSSVDHTGLRLVSSIAFERYDKFYDMHVAGSFNYVAEQLVNHNTGIGKGRVVAAMIRYAHQKGMTPVFVTEKPDLYGDMWRDLHDIGFDKSLGRPIKMFMTNSNTRVALDDEAVEWVADSEVAKANGEKVPVRRGTFSSSQTPEAAVDDMRGLLDGAYKPDVVFTTYDQMNSVKGAETPRRQFLRAVANRSLIILDEAHNAGGQGEAARENKQKAVPRAKVFREALKDAKAVVYSSATYAKSPKVMDLFARTDMSKAVENPNQLPDLIARGGVPLQQAVSTMLAKAGQYIRRERSFEGVKYEVEPVQIDEKTYANFTTAIGAIFKYDLGFEEEKSAFLKKHAIEHGAGSAKDEGVGEGGGHATAFASVMHNMIGQMILSIKAEPSARLAIDAIRAGKKPVIALSQTMESFLKDYADAAGIKEGDAINADFTQVLLRYLERTRRVTVKNPDGEKVHVYISDEEMTPSALAAYKATEATVKSMDFGSLSISPIDRIRSMIEEAGYSVREVTGRSNMIDYSGDADTLKARPSGEKGSSGKRVTIKMFNDGKLDAVILNKSGSTGVSLHASEKYKDKRPRVMIIVQADANIDTHMQMLGRVHRTGQVELPAYQQVMANIPAEVRPAAVLMKKMASLNANTTASRKSVFTGEALDFMNAYGDRVIARILVDDRDLAHKLGDPKVGEAPYEGVAARVTGRLTLLEPKEQQELLDRIAHDYKTEIDMLDAAGENMLEAKSIDLKAQPVDASTLKPSTGPSPFQSAVNMEKMSVKAQGRAMAPDEVTTMLAENLGKKGISGTFAEQMVALREAGKNQLVKIGEETRLEAKAHLDKELAAAKAIETKERVKAAANETYKRWKSIATTAYAGNIVNIEIGGERTPAIVLGIKRGDKVKNPLALSGWEASFAVPTSRRTVSVPFSKISIPGQFTVEGEKTIPVSFDRADAQAFASLEKQFENARKEGRENRYVMTGNILAGYDQTGGNGQIVNFTMDDGSIRAGILMNRAFDPKKFLGERKVRFKTGEQVIRFLEEPKVDGEVVSTDNVIAIRSAPNSPYRGLKYEFEVPTSKGKPYYTDSDVRKVYDSWQKYGSKMRATLRDRAEAVKMVDALMGLDATFETSTNQDIAQQIVGGEAPKAMASIAPEPMAKLSQKAQDAGLSEAHLKNIVFDIIERTTGIPREHASRFVRFHDGSIQIETDDAALNSYGYTDEQKARIAKKGAQGMFTPGKNGAFGIIDIAMSGDPANSIHHELLHLFQDMGVITKPEWQVLTNEGPRLRRLLAGKFGRSAEHFSQAETTANAYGYYAAARDAGRPVSGLHVGIRRAFEKIYQVLRRVRNYFTGLGFQTSEDIFERARSGGMAVQNRAWDTTGNSSLLANTRNTRALSIAPEKSWGDTRSKIIEQAFDRMLRLREAQEHVLDAGAAAVPDVYRAETLSYGRVNERAETLWKEHVEPLQKAMKAADISLPEFDNYLYARHAEERNDVIAARNPGNPVYADGGSGMETGEANTILANVAASGKQAEYEALARRVYAMLEEDNNRRLGAGLMDQDTVDEWDRQYSNYVPLQGFEGDEDSRHGTGSGVKVRGKESRAALGRKSRAESPLVNVINKAVEGIIRSEKNRVGNMVLRLARADIALGPDATGLFEILKKSPMKRVIENGVVKSIPDHNYKNEPDVFVTKVGGKEIAIRIHDDRLAAALNGLLSYDLDGALQVISATTRVYSRLRTVWNPLFPPKNFVRDIEDASIYAHSKGIGAEFIKALPGAKKESFKAIFGKESPEFREFRLSGGKVTYSDVKTIDEIRNRIRRSFQGMTFANIGRKLGSIMEHWNDLFEATTRYALYRAALNAGKSQAEAASISLEGTLNFYRRGAARIMEVAAATNPFWNAKMQAPLRAGRLFKFNRRYRRVMAGLIVTGFLQGMLNYFVGGDDDDGIPFFDKLLMGGFDNDRNIIVYTGGKDSKGRPNGFKIPSFPEVMFPVILGQTIAAAIFGKQPLAALVGRNIKSLWQVSPLEGSSFIPPVVKPMYDVHNNEDWTGRTIHNDPFPNQKGIALSEVMRPNTDKKWQQIARLIGTAGEAVSPVMSAKFTDLHPEDVRYLVKEYTGAAYGLAEYMAGKLGVTDSTGDPRPPPIVRDFVLQGRAHETFDRIDLEKREGKARTEKARISSQFAKPGQTASETHRENKRSRDEIEAAGGRVGPNGGINTISTEIFDTGRAVVRALYKQMAAVKEQSISKEEKTRKVADIQSQILDARRKYSELEKKAKAGKGDAADISNELRATRRELRHLETAQ